MEGNKKALRGSTKNADAFVLRQIIHDMIPLVNEKFELYQDLAQRLHEEPKETKKIYSFSSDTIFSNKPSRLDMKQLDIQLSKLKPRLKQLAEERKKRRAANSAAINDLTNEIELLKKEIAKLSPSKRPFVTPARKRTRKTQIRSDKSLPL